MSNTQHFQYDEFNTILSEIENKYSYSVDKQHLEQMYDIGIMMVNRKFNIKIVDVLTNIIDDLTDDLIEDIRLEKRNELITALQNGIKDGIKNDKNNNVSNIEKILSSLK